MKKLLLILCLFLAFNSYSQTTTKKYNDLKNRYEYYQNGRMIGYEKYNSLRDQWEYYSTQSSQSTSSYSDPVSTFDADLAMKVLQAKQDRFDYNVKRIEKFLKRLGEHVYEIEEKYEGSGIGEEINELF